jgi:hypothetical protein
MASINPLYGGTMNINDLPKSWQREVKELRKENARLRMRSRELRLQLDELTEASDRDIAAT